MQLGALHITATGDKWADDTCFCFSLVLKLQKG